MASINLKFLHISPFSTLVLFVVLFSSCSTHKHSQQEPAVSKTSKRIITEVYITAVQISSFPKYTPTGEKWDSYAPFATDPDIFIQFKWNNQSIYRSETKEDCAYGTPLSFTQGVPFRIKPFDQTLLVEVFDEDGVSSNDILSYFNLNLLDYKGKKQIQIKDTKSELELLLSIDWRY